MIEDIVGIKLVHKETGEEIWIKSVNDPLSWDYPVTVGNSPGTCYTGWRVSFETLRQEYTRAY